MKFDLDFQKWVLWMLPAIVRQPKMLAFLRALIAPLEALHTQFSVFRVCSNEQARVTGQVCVLRAHLNDLFDADLRRIALFDDSYLPTLYMYKEVENRPLFLAAHLVTAGGADFLVKIPQVLTPHEVRIKVQLNRFKLVDKTFRIEYF